VDIAPSQLLPRLVRLALIGVATAFAWIVVSLVLGMGSGHAHAADDGTAPRDGLPGSGLLGSVTSLVDGAASTVTHTVSTVTSEVADAVNAVVAVAPAPVSDPVREVVQTVGHTVATITAPVTDVVSGGVVSTITAPVVEAVTRVPVVGGIVSGIGLDGAVANLGTIVDDTVAGVVGAVTDTAATVGLPPVEAPAPGGAHELIPTLPGPSGPADAAATTIDEATDAEGSAVRIVEATASVLFLRSAVTPTSAAHHTPTALIAISGAPGPSPLPGGLCPPAVSSSGPGGAGSGAWALLALGPLVAHRAWVRRAGPEDEHAPPAPVGSTDVSPD